MAVAVATGPLVFCKRRSVDISPRVSDLLFNSIDSFPGKCGYTIAFGAICRLSTKFQSDFLPSDCLLLRFIPIGGNFFSPKCEQKAKYGFY